jgi:hypothetical protein
MTKDGFVRKLVDGNKRIQAKARENANREIDTVQMRMIPSVDVGRALVSLTCGKTSLTYRVEQVGKAWGATFIPAASLNPMKVDPHATALKLAAVQSYLQASGRTNLGYFVHDVRRLVGRDKRPLPGLSAVDAEYVRAVVALDPLGRGVATASWAQVGEQAEKNREALASG